MDNVITNIGLMLCASSLLLLLHENSVDFARTKFGGASVHVELLPFLLLQYIFHQRNRELLHISNVKNENKTLYHGALRK